MKTPFRRSSDGKMRIPASKVAKDMKEEKAEAKSSNKKSSSKAC